MEFLITFILIYMIIGLIFAFIYNEYASQNMEILFIYVSLATTFDDWNGLINNN
jgi:hypothetical protein